MEAFVALHEQTKRDRRLAPLRRPSAELVRRSAAVQQQEAPEALRLLGSTLKEARKVVSSLNVSEAEKQSLREKFLQGKAEVERYHRMGELAQRGRGSAAERFSTLAFLYAQGEPEDRQLLLANPWLKSGEQEGLRQRVEVVLGRREVERRRQSLLGTYHLLMLRVQRGQSDERDEAELAGVAAELELCEDELSAGAALLLSNKIEGLHRVYNELHRIGDELQALRAQMKAEGEEVK